MKTAVKYVERLSTSELAGAWSSVDAEQQISKDMKTRLAWRDTEGKPQGFGLWEATPGKKRSDFSKYSELMVILSGRVRVADASGAAEEFKAGEGLVVHKGFKGTFEAVEHVKKIFYIWE